MAEPKDTMATEEQQPSIFAVETHGMVLYFQDFNNRSAEDLLNDYGGCNGNISQLGSECKKLSEAEFAELEQRFEAGSPNPPAYSAYINADENTVTIQRENGSQTMDLQQAIEQATLPPATPQVEDKGLLPIFHAKAEQHSAKLDSLASKKAVLEDKVSNNKAKIEQLTEKAERLTATAEMLQALKADAPPALQSALDVIIKRNESKAAKIYEEKIPAHEAKIEKHTNKIADIDHKTAVTQCKLDRCTNMSKLIQSFGIMNPTERRQQFAQALDGLHKATAQSLTFRVERCDKQISQLSEQYMATDSAVDKMNIHTKLNKIKNRKSEITDRLDKLNGVSKPYAEQPDATLDAICTKTEHTLEQMEKQEVPSIPQISEKICMDSISELPEKSLAVPDKSNDAALLPEIAELMNMSVSELESKPQDIKEMLVSMYTANYFSDPATLQESLADIINPNPQTEKEIAAKQETLTDKTVPAKDKTAEKTTQQAETQLEFAMDKGDSDKTEKPAPKQQQTFSFSRKSMKAAADKAAQTPTKPKQQERNSQALE